MSAYAGIAAVLAVAAITPGPNNLIVLRTAAVGGLRDAAAAIAGVLSGGLLLLTIVAAGIGALVEVLPWLRFGITAVGCLYLMWLAASLFIGSSDWRASNASDPLSVGATSMLVFQFMNPKGWAMMLAIVSAAPTDAGIPMTVLYLAPLFLTISATCLLLWSLLGVAMMRRLRRRHYRLWFNRVMGVLLAASALLLLAQA